MMKNEVTRGVYQNLLRSESSSFSSYNDHPVEDITWYAAVQFANALSEKEGLEQCYSQILIKT